VRGESVEQIRSALQDLLRTKGISGEVAEMPYGTLGNISGLLFHVDGISLPIKGIAFSGEAALSDRQLSEASAGLKNQDFSVTNVASFASAALLPLYYQRGYLRSRFVRANVSMIDASSKGPVTDVSITLPVIEGNQYFWNGVSWSGNQVLSANDLAKLLEMNPKDVANQEKIDGGFAQIGRAYRSRGYINVRVAPTRGLDDAARLVSYAVQVDEGSQFRMGQVYFDGVPERLAAALLRKWKLKPGDVYDASYPADFLKNVAGKELAQEGSSFHSTTIKEEPDPNTLIVNLHIQFH
jgi:outer membrane protein insertion porin family